MASSKLVKANEKIAEKVTTVFQEMSDGVTTGFQKMCDTVVGGYTKIEDGVQQNGFGHRDWRRGHRCAADVDSADQRNSWLNVILLLSGILDLLPEMPLFFYGVLL